MCEEPFWWKAELRLGGRCYLKYSTAVLLAGISRKGLPANPPWQDLERR